MSTSSREVRLRPEYAEVYRGIPPASLGRGASRSERWTRSTLSFEAPRTSPGERVRARGERITQGQDPKGRAPHASAAGLWRVTAPHLHFSTWATSRLPFALAIGLTGELPPARCASPPPHRRTLACPISPSRSPSTFNARLFHLVRPRATRAHVCSSPRDSFARDGREVGSCGRHTHAPPGPADFSTDPQYR